MLAGIIFIVSTYFIQLYFPSNPNIYFKPLDESQPVMVAAIGSIAFKTLVLYFAVVAVMASGISAHAGVSRLMYVMGRDGVINKSCLVILAQDCILRLTTFLLLVWLHYLLAF